MKRPIITLLTDFGSVDHYAAAMKGVILGICPEVQLVDISHEITPYAITEAAFTLAQAWRCFPEGTVHLVVIDPGVGSSRRPILMETAGQRFVAPDNGVLTMLLDLEGKTRVREITARRYFRKRVSQTFHGRDIFAPVAAHLAAGVQPAKFGKQIRDCIRLDFSEPARTAPRQWSGVILKIDRFGNLITNFESGAWKKLADEPFEMRLRTRCVSTIAVNYSEMEAGELFVIAGSAGFLEVSMKQASAAAAIGIESGEAVDLRLL